MKVTVEGKVVSGVDRGGEDLFLVFCCKEFDNEPVEVELVEGPGVSLTEDDEDEDDEDEDDDEEDCDEEEFDPEKTVHTFRTYHYGFEWSGTLGSLRKKAVDLGLLDEKQWCWTGPCSEPPKKEFKRSVYVAGNAD